MVVSTGMHSQQFGGLSEGVCPVGHAAQRTFEQGPAPMALCPDVPWSIVPCPVVLLVPPVLPVVPVAPVDVPVVPVVPDVPVAPWSPVPPVAHAQSTSRPITIANFCNLLMGPPLVDSST